MEEEPIAKRTCRSRAIDSTSEVNDERDELEHENENGELLVENGNEEIEPETEPDIQQNTVEAAVNEPQPVNVPENIQAIWEYEQTFANQADLENFFQNEKCWSLLKSERLVKGIKTTYRCNRVKRRGNQCMSRLYTLQSHDTVDQSIKLFRRRAEHSCEQSKNRVSTKIGDDVKNFILDQYKLGNPPATIIFKLREKTGINQPSKDQVNHIINYYKEKLPKTDVSIAQMTEFFKSHSSVPENDDDPFVVNFSCSPPRTLNEEKFFRIFYSTKR